MNRTLRYRPRLAVSQSTDKTTIADGITAVLDAHEAAGSTRGTISNYGVHLRRFSEFMEGRGRVFLEDVTAPDIVAFYAYLRVKLNLADTTISTASICVNRTFNLAERTGALHGPNVARAVERPRVRQPMRPAFSDDELRRLWEAAHHARGDVLRNLGLFTLMLDTGARIGEACALLVRDVDLTAGRVTIRAGKGGKGRTVFLSPKACDTLKLMIAFTRPGAKPHEPLFVSRQGTALSPATVRAWLNRIGERAGVEDVHPHRFRRTFAVTFLRNGGDLERLRRLMGHTDYTMLQLFYLPLVDDDLRQAHEQFSPVAGLGLGLDVKP